ncbi:PhzF family phenazine biosynthesis protein [uncultured Rhodoblastus sp.]|uniref:PhzF family phenazine biosynthesis protein n=1 Tax=uncultured Rhodoblastus sp. TaxID=543037 RepID=UPI0025D6A548|nr:PhzF family phenazine biosynthesis protein [uncultured Rhodoblastus sp.]
MRLAYHLLDVFTEKPLAGNPLAVLPEADGLGSDQMQAIAREFNLSETVFVLRPRNSLHAARLRIFTPIRELPFAGHPTVGAAALIALLRAPEMIARQPLGLVLEEEIGPVACEVWRHNGAIRARFAAPQPPKILGVLAEREKIAAALGLAAEDLGFDAHRPVIASAGLDFAFIPVAGLNVLNRLAPKFEIFGAAFGLDCPAAFVYTRETNDPANHVQARVFAPGMGVGEDPATGSAACAFASVACAFERPEDGEHALVIEQGFAVGRPSLIALTLQVAGGALTQTSVGGACVQVGEGFLTI